MESGDRYAFFGVDSDTCAMTTDRTEFIGRNGALERPAAMSAATLSGASGAALDPCAAIQVPFELADGQDREIVLKLGAGRHEAEDRKRVVKGTSVSVRVALGGSRVIKKKKNDSTSTHTNSRDDGET